MTLIPSKRERYGELCEAGFSDPNEMIQIHDDERMYRYTIKAPAYSVMG